MVRLVYHETNVLCVNTREEGRMKAEGGGMKVGMGREGKRGEAHTEYLPHDFFTVGGPGKMSAHPTP